MTGHWQYKFPEWRNLVSLEVKRDIDSQKMFERIKEDHRKRAFKEELQVLESLRGDAEQKKPSSAATELGTNRTNKLSLP